ncbi:MAG: McrC family protein [Gemmatimonadota bacterium]|nr:McrC family protein [Gemmatimonadota bacterium]
MLEVLPKTERNQDVASSRGLLLRLLRAAGPSQIFRHLQVSQRLYGGPLLEIFIAALFDEVANVIRSGLLRQYRKHEEDIAVVRGRINFTYQAVRLWNRPDVLACKFDDLTVDNKWNRVVKSALRDVRPWITSSLLRRRWSELIVVFDEVADFSFESADLRDMFLDRQAIRYKEVLSWARLIFALLTPEVRGGKDPAPGLLFDMNLLFQTVVVSLFRRECQTSPNIEVLSQDTGRYLGDESTTRITVLALRPDLVIKKGGKVVAVADAKWKEPFRNEEGFVIPSAEDAYQMHAYSTAYECRSLLLAYPCFQWHASTKPTAISLAGALGASLRIACVDLSSEVFRLRNIEGVVLDMNS